MASTPATRPAFNPAAKAPQLSASQRRLLADPFSLGGDVVAWEPPGDADWCKRERTRIMAVKGQLERGLASPTPSHMQWCVNKLFALPTRDGTATTAALQADNFIDACGHYPDDLWTWATTELLKAHTFRPSPAEMVKLVEPKYAERKRMLERCQAMLGAAPAKQIEGRTEQPIPTRLGRLMHTRGIYERMGRRNDVERMDREIEREQGLAPETVESGEKYSNPMQAEPGPYVPADTPTNRRMAELATAHRSGKPAPERRDVAEAS